MTEPTVSILLPTLGRADRLEGLVANIAEATPAGRWQLIFALDQMDMESWDVLAEIDFTELMGQVGAVACDGTLPVKTNAAYRFSSAPLVLPTADDVVFHDGWLEKVIEAFEDVGVDGTEQWFRWHVVGVNDLSPMSNAEHSTMPVIRRAYIESKDYRGCSFEEPGKVFHEGYQHNFVETEVCRLARWRGVWKYEPDAVIEHLHPSWGKREEDATDRKGGLGPSFDRDQKLHEERHNEWSRRAR